MHELTYGRASKYRYYAARPAEGHYSAAILSSLGAIPWSDAFGMWFILFQRTVKLLYLFIVSAAAELSGGRSSGVDEDATTRSMLFKPVVPITSVRALMPGTHAYGHCRLIFLPCGHLVAMCLRERVPLLARSQLAAWKEMGSSSILLWRYVLITWLPCIILMGLNTFMYTGVSPGDNPIEIHKWCAAAS